MHGLIGLAGLLGLIALAFGERAAVRVAQAVILAAVLLILLVAIDIISHGALSDHL